MKVTVIFLPYDHRLRLGLFDHPVEVGEGRASDADHLFAHLDALAVDVTQADEFNEFSVRARHAAAPHCHAANARADQRNAFFGGGVCGPNRASGGDSRHADASFGRVVNELSA